MNWTKEFIDSWWTWRRKIDKIIGTLDPEVVGTLLQRMSECEEAVNNFAELIGDTTIETEADTITGAINELLTLINNINELIGDDTLDTEAQTIIGAINELAEGGSGGGHEILNNEGTTVTQRSKMKFNAPLNASDDSENEVTDVTADTNVDLSSFTPPSSTPWVNGGHALIDNEGVPVQSRNSLKFLSPLNVVDDNQNGRTDAYIDTNVDLTDFVPPVAPIISEVVELYNGNMPSVSTSASNPTDSITLNESIEHFSTIFLYCSIYQNPNSDPKADICSTFAMPVEFLKTHYLYQCLQCSLMGDSPSYYFKEAFSLKDATTLVRTESVLNGWGAGTRKMIVYGMR